MAKRIVFCADGTWQNPLINTNVHRLYKGLTQSQDRVTFYDEPSLIFWRRPSPVAP